MPSPRNTVAAYENEHIRNLRRAWELMLVDGGLDPAIACASARWPASSFSEAHANAKEMEESFARAYTKLGPLPRPNAWAPRLRASSLLHGMRRTGFPAFLLQTPSRAPDLHAGGLRGEQPVRLEPQRGP